MGNGPTIAATGATPGAGATPAQTATDGSPAGATPATGTAGTPPATTTPPATPPATGDDGIGDAGRRAIQVERESAKAAEARAAAAERELQQLREASQSDQEKALTQAKREASQEERGKWTDHIRRTEVRSALRAAGLTDDKALGLAAGAPEFSKLKVTDEGSVEQLTQTVEQFKKDYPVMFGTAQGQPAQGGAWDGSAGGGGGAEPKTLEDAISAHYQRH